MKFAEGCWCDLLAHCYIITSRRGSQPLLSSSYCIPTFLSHLTSLPCPALPSQLNINRQPGVINIIRAEEQTKNNTQQLYNIFI